MCVYIFWMSAIVHYDLDLWPFDPKVATCMKYNHGNNSVKFHRLQSNWRLKAGKSCGQYSSFCKFLVKVFSIVPYDIELWPFDSKFPTCTCMKDLPSFINCNPWRLQKVGPMFTFLVKVFSIHCIMTLTFDLLTKKSPHVRYTMGMNQPSFIEIQVSLKYYGWMWLTDAGP